MAYLGNTPAARFSAMDKQTITGDGTTGPYTLDHAVGNEQEIEVFVNNVRQEPSVAYTVVGTALTMTGNVASTDDFYVVFQGKAQQTVTHPSSSALQATTGTFSGALSATTGTFSGATSSTDLTLSGGLYLGGTGAANYLDDYEEGTWTPIFTQLTSAPSSTTYSAGTYGRYTKIGRLVQATCRVELTAVSGGSGQVAVGGLPYVSVSSGDAFTASLGVVFGGWSSTAAPRIGFMSNGQSYVKLYTHDSADARDGIDTPVNALAVAGLIMNITYSTS